MSAAKPKSAKPGNRPPVLVEDPAALLPLDVQQLTEAPFQVTWQPAVYAVHATDGINLSTIKDAFKQLHVVSHISLSDLAARLDPADPLCAELASAAAEGQQHVAAEGGSLPVSAAAKLLQRQFGKEEVLAWKFEVVRRRDQLAKAEAEAQVAQEALADAEAAKEAASGRLQAVKARLPQPPPAPVTPPAQQEPTSTDDAAAEALAEDKQDSEHAGPHAGTGATAVPPLNLQQLQPQEVTLTPEQRRSLNDATAGLEVAEAQHKLAQEAATAAGAALAAAQSGINSPFLHYEPYWCEGLPSTAAGLSAVVSAGVPLRVVVWMHPPSSSPTAEANTGRRASAAGGSTRPASAASLRLSAGGAPAAVVHTLPGELQQLQGAIQAAAWDAQLSSLLVMELPVEEATSPFTRVPAGSSITDPAWAAASSAAAAAKATAAAAAAAALAASAHAADSKQGSAAGGKPGSAAPSIKPSRPGSSVTGGTAAASATAAAAASLPEEVMGCKELARALLTITDQAKRFDVWRRFGVHVYRMPPPAAPGMGYYRHLLDSVAPKRHSVPLVLHAMLEQVRQNCMLDSAPEAAAEADQAILAAQIDSAISSAFSSLVDETTGLVQEPTPGSDGLTLLSHGDYLTKAACGLSTGYVHGLQQRGAAGQPAAAAGTYDAMQQATGPDWGFAAHGLSSNDVDSVEQHMLQLLQLPGVSGLPGDDLETDSEAGLERQLQQAELKSVCQDVPYGTVQRSQLLAAAADMLPPEVQAAHAADIQGRHHKEPLQPHVLRQVLQHCSMELPDAAGMPYQPTGEQLLALYAGPQLDRADSRSMPHAMTFSQYWRKLLQGSCTAPDLQPQVYEMGEAAARQQWQQRLLYTDAGSIARTGTNTLLAVTQGPTLVRLLQPDQADQPFQVVATLDHGSVVAASIVAAAPAQSCPGTASLSASSSMKDGPRASDAGSTGALAAVPPSPSSSSSTAKKRPGSGTKAAHGALQPALSAVPESCGPEACEDAAASAGASLGAQGTGRSMPQWGALCVSMPQGLRVQLSTDGRVLMEPVDVPHAQVVQATGVDVLGAPLAAGKLQAAVAASASQWHAVLPDGTLIKASADAAAGAISAARSATGPTGQCLTAGAAASGCRATSVLHTDGSVSQHHKLELPLVGVDGELRQEVDGWLRTGPDGEQTWVVDTVALQDLWANLAKAAEEAAVAAAAMAAEAAEAAAAAETTGKKGSKDKKGLGKTVSSKQAAKQQQQQQQQDPAGPAAEAAAGSSGNSTAADSVHVQAAAAAEAALHELEHQAPQFMGSIRAVQLTDADTRAVVTTREDHLLIVDYPDGSRLLQDAEGCRLSHVQGTWLFEAAGLPAVKGGELGVELQPCPGVSLSWDAASSCVTLQHTLTGAAISLSPTGHLVYSPAGQPVEPFLDGCIDLVQQDQQQALLHQELQRNLLDEQHADSTGEHQQHQQPSQQPSQQAGAEAAQQQQELGEAQACAEGQQAEPHSQQLTLPGLCSQLDCQGLLCFDLMTGEAALYEADTCRIHVGPGGCITVLDNGQNAAEAEADAEDATAEAKAAREPVPPPDPPAAAANSAEDEEGLTDEEIAAKRAAAAAAAQAAAEAAAAEQAAAEAAAAAARAKPKPVAPSIKPRLFVIQPRTGCGYEVLPADVVEQHAAWVSAQPGHQHLQQEVLGADEPGTSCHTFLESYSHKPPALQPLQVAAPTLALPVYVDPDKSLVSLRRAGTVVPAEWQSGRGLKLPRIAALNPWHLAQAAAGTLGDAVAGTAAGANDNNEASVYLGTAATRMPGSSGALAGSGAGAPAGEGSAGCSEQVVVVREVLELPVLGPEAQDKVAAAVEAWRAQKAEQQLLLQLQSPSPAPCSQQQQADADSVGALLEAAGFAAVPPDGLAIPSTAADAATGASAAIQQAEHTRTKSRDRSAASSALQGASAAGSAGQGRLREVKDMLLEQQQLAAAAEAKAQADAAARAAAEAAAKKKPYKPWVKHPGPYDFTPKRPEPGQTLKYFNTQEGMQALAQDPLLAVGTHITKAGVPPPKPVQPASAGIQQVPGVYLASSTALCAQDCQAEAAGSSDPAGPAAAAGAAAGTMGQASQWANSTSAGSSIGSGRAGGASVSPQRAPLMHAGRPTRLGSPVAQSLTQQQQQQASEGLGDQLGTSISSSSGGKDPVLAVYGQPRVLSPPLPATYSKAHAAGSLNAEYLAREGAALRTVKTSSTNLVRASGKDGKQIVLRPGHLHFGSIPQGAVVHRTAKLLNGSADVVRFTIVRPELPLRVLHKPAPLPPGMEANCTVELVAESPGDFVGEVVVKTELNIFSLSVSAKVLPAAEAEAVSPAGVSASAATDQLSSSGQL